MRTQFSPPALDPHALRAPELHDFSDFPGLPALRHRVVVMALAIATLLVTGRLVLNGTFKAARPDDGPRHTLTRA